MNPNDAWQLLVEETDINPRIPSCYNKRIQGITIDPYKVLYAFEITDPCVAHAIKKLLRAGESHKELHQEIAEVISTLQRWQEIQKELKY